MTILHFSNIISPPLLEIPPCDESRPALAFPSRLRETPAFYVIITLARYLAETFRIEIKSIAVGFIFPLPPPVKGHLRRSEIAAIFRRALIRRRELSRIMTKPAASALKSLSRRPEFCMRFSGLLEWASPPRR